MNLLLVAAVLVAAAAVTALVFQVRGKQAFERHIASTKKSVMEAESRASQPDDRPIPPALRRFAERSGARPDLAPRGVFYRQAVAFRRGRGKPFGPLTAEQTVSFRRPFFAWTADQRLGPILVARVLDASVPEGGLLRVCALGSIPVLDLEGPDVSRGERMRYLAELPWAPDAIFHNREIRFRELADGVIEVETDGPGGAPVTVRVTLDAAGDVIEVLADRGSFENGKVVVRPWHGRFSDYREMGGRRIPVRAEVGWVYEEGYEAYFRGEITEYRLTAD